MHLRLSVLSRLGPLAVALAAGALAIPSAASAGTLTVDDAAHTVTYTAAPGEVNDFSFYRLANTYRIQDPGVASVPLSEIGGSLCSVGEPWKFRCPVSSVDAANVSLGDGADSFDATVSSIAVTVSAGPGAKQIATGSGADTVLARNGSIDQISCGDGQDSVVADTGDVVDPSCEQVDRGTYAGDPGGGPGSVAGTNGTTGGTHGAGTNSSQGVFDTPLGLTVALATVPVANSQARIRLACAADADQGCRGEMSLELPRLARPQSQKGRVIAARGQYVARQRKRRNRLGRQKYRIAAGDSKTVVVPLLLRGHYRYLSRRRRSRAVLRITERDPAGKVVDVQTRSITLSHTSKQGQR